MNWLEHIHQNSTVDDNGCWSWKGRRTKNNHPIMSLWLNGIGDERDEIHKNIDCQSVSYWFGRLPNLELRDVKVKSACNLKDCCNPEHLELSGNINANS